VAQILDDPQKLFAYKLGTALSSEKKILAMLKKLEKRAQKDELKQQFRHHREETEQQIRNIEQAFKEVGEKATGRANPTVEGLSKQADAMWEKTDWDLVDNVLLGGAAETEHLEIALYEDLIQQARSLGQQQVVSLLSENLEQEQHTLEEVKRASKRLSGEPVEEPTSSTVEQPSYSSPEQVS
jgi:ferritin-like metal-binding protein YciE